MTRILRYAAGLFWFSAPLWAQEFSIAPTVSVADYREVSSSLRYRGVGPGVLASFTFHRFSLDGHAAWLGMDPAGSATNVSYHTAQYDGWVRFAVTDYFTLEIGATSRSPDDAFAAQAVGAIRAGLETHYALGHGTSISLRGDYLGGAQFSGGGSAPLALELGLSLNVALAKHVGLLVDYSFQRYDRHTNPGGGPQADAALEQALGFGGLAVNF